MCVKKSFNALIIFLVLFGQTVAAHNYRQLFGHNYEKAEQHVQTLQPLLHRYAQLYHEDERLLEAIIFPELMRYSQVSDVVETGSLMGLYSRFGAGYANFSIGLMQMKPSFAETIETYTLQRPTLNHVQTLGLKSEQITDSYPNRTARISRLADVEWQVRYLISFIKCLQHKHAALWTKLPVAERVRFAAAAYNCGWEKSTHLIQSFIYKPYYHLSRWNTGSNYCYADVASYRYKELLPAL
jgi:hypothetical protein